MKGMGRKAKKTSFLMEMIRLVKHPELFVKWWSRWRTVPVIDWIKAAQCFRERDFHTASKLYAAGLKRNSRHRAALCARFDYAYSLYRLGRLDEAKEQLRVITKRDGKLRDAYLLLASIELTTGDATDAIHTLQRAVDIFAEDSKVASAYAHALMTANAPKPMIMEAKAKLESQREQLPLESPQVELIDAALARFEILYGNQDLGDRLVSRVLAGGRAPIEIILLRGEKLLEKNRILLAREQFTRAMRKSPSNPRSPMLLARSYLRDGAFKDTTRAVQLATLACNLSRWNDVECLYVLSEAYRESGEFDASELVENRASILSSTHELSFDEIQKTSLEVERLRSMS